MNDQEGFAGWQSAERLPEAFVVMLNEIIAEREVIEKKGFIKIADELGVAPALLSRWRAGVGPLDLEAIQKLATSLGSWVYIVLGLDRPDDPFNYRNRNQRAESYP